jgi:ribose transport system permease protein
MSARIPTRRRKQGSGFSRSCSRCSAFAAPALGSAPLISVSLVGAAAATFGYQEEFPAIAAAVLGGASLFGGRGGVFGSIFGAVPVQTTANGLVMLNANLYLYPLVNSLIIFVAAWVDGRRRLMTERIGQRTIRNEA